MTEAEYNAAGDVPGLLKFTGELLALVQGIWRHPIRYSEEDHLAFMALCFVAKQVEHLTSIRTLVESGQARDATLIARSMMEGMCLLLWAAAQPSVRPLLWRSFAYVEDFRLMQEEQTAGKSIDPAEQALISQGLNLHGEQFLSKKARKAREEGKALPRDPYRPTWTEKNVSQIFDEVKGQLLYSQVYKPVSKWTHWGVGSIGGIIRRDAQGVRYSFQSSPADAATALAVAFQALLQSFELLNQHLQLIKASDVEDLRVHYITWHQREEN